MRLSTAISVLSASGALAGNYGMPVAGAPPAGHSSVWASKPALYAAADPSAMAHGSGMSSVMAHDATKTPTVHHTTSTTMAHETTPPAAHGYAASVSPPMVHEGPITHTVSHINIILSIEIYS